MKIIKLIKSVAFVTIASLISIVFVQAESPSYTVDSSNYMQHADKLTDGQMKTLKAMQITELMYIQLLQNVDCLMR